MSALLQVNNLTRSFGGLKAVSDLSFSVTKGDIVGLIGPNGAGKTTVVNLISGLLQPASGNIILDGEDITNTPTHKRSQKGLVRTFQSTVVYTAQTVRENVLRGSFMQLYPGFFAALVRTTAAKKMEQTARQSADKILSLLGLTLFADTLAGSLPYGIQKTLGIAIALAAEPKLILLDEPVAGLSAEEVDHVKNTIKTVRSNGVTVVVIDHNMRFIAGLCDRVVVISQGSFLAEGTPSDVLSNQLVIDAYLGKSYAAT